MVYWVIVLFRGSPMQFFTHNKHKTDTIVAVTSKPTSSHEESILKPIQPSGRSSSTWKPQTLDVHQQQGKPIGEEIAETIHESRTKDQQDARRLNSRGGNSGSILSNFLLLFLCSFFFSLISFPQWIYLVVKSGSKRRNQQNLIWHGWPPYSTPWAMNNTEIYDAWVVEKHWGILASYISEPHHNNFMLYNYKSSEPLL